MIEPQHREVVFNARKTSEVLQFNETMGKEVPGPSSDTPKDPVGRKCYRISITSLVKYI